MSAATMFLRSHLIRNSADQPLTDLNRMANALHRDGAKPPEVLRLLGAEIDRAEREAGKEVVVKNGSQDGVWFRFYEKQKPDSVRLETTPYKKVKIIDARLDDVILSVNFFKPDVYNHSNAHVARSLRRLADVIEKTPERLSDAPDQDLPL